MVLEKRGLSTIVATIALILLTFATIVIISAFIVPFVRDNLTEGTECFDYLEYFMFEEEFGYNCYEYASGNKFYGITLSADSVGEEAERQIVGFKLSFVGGGESIPVDVTNGNPATYGEGGIMMLNPNETTLRIPQSGEVRTYVYQDNNNFTFVEVSPALVSGRVCDVSDSIRIGGKVCTETLVEEGLCTDGDIQACSLNSGVCTGINQTCIDGAWAGCDVSDYGSDYEDIETRCSDGLDNDCDNALDCADSDCADGPACTNSSCGNGFLESGESCDDGNNFDGDGCSSTCIEEIGYRCLDEPSRCYRSVTCGSILDQNGAYYVLERGDGLAEENAICLTITADNVTFDGLASVDDFITGNGYLNTVGIFVQDAVNVTIINATATSFETGILFNNVADSRIALNDVAENRESGINLLSSTGNVIEDNQINSNDQFGVFLFGSSQNTFLFNDITANSGWGMMLLGNSDDNAVSNNVVCESLLPDLQCALGFDQSSNGNTGRNNFADLNFCRPQFDLNNNIQSGPCPS